MLFPTPLDLSVVLYPLVFRRRSYVVGCIRLRSMPLHSRRHSRHPGKVLGQRFCGQSGALFPLRGFSKIDPPPQEERNIRNGKMVPQRNMLFRAGPRIRIQSPRHTWWKEKVNLLFSDLDMHGSGHTGINFNFFFFLDGVSL